MSDSIKNKTSNNYLDALLTEATDTNNIATDALRQQLRYRLEKAQALKVTVDKLVDRGDRLDALSARADDLNTSSVHFHGAARRVQRRMKWQNYKITVCIIVVVIIVITLIIVLALKPWEKK